MIEQVIDELRRAGLLYPDSAQGVVWICEDGTLHGLAPSLGASNALVFGLDRAERVPLRALLEWLTSPQTSPDALWRWLSEHNTQGPAEQIDLFAS